MPPVAAPAAMNWIEAISIVSGLASLILAILAIWLALYFYTKTRDSEGRVAVGLEAIKTQTDALQKLTGRWMDRLTRYATEAKPADESFVVLVQALREMPGTVINLLRPPAAGATPEALRNEVVSGYIGIYYYAAVTNLMSQGYLPADREQADARVVEMVDQSHRDYQLLERLLGGVDQRLIQNNVFNRQYQTAVGWRPLILDVESVYRNRRAQQA